MAPRRGEAQGAHVVMGLSPAELVALAAAAVLVGFAKTALGGAASLSVAVFATVLPAKESTGAILPLLLVGDLLALRAYRRHADWRTLLRLLPTVAVGVLVGVLFMARVDDTTMRRAIAGVLLLLVGVHLWMRRQEVRTAATDTLGSRHVLSGGFGLLAGFTTMVANAGGPVMSLYLLTRRLEILGFLGTSAWFFFLVNVFKVPFSIQLGLITRESLLLCLLLAPAVVAGALMGPPTIARISRAAFERLVLALTVGASLYLLF